MIELSVTSKILVSQTHGGPKRLTYRDTALRKVRRRIDICGLNAGHLSCTGLMRGGAAHPSGLETASFQDLLLKTQRFLICELQE